VSVRTNTKYVAMDMCETLLIYRLDAIL